ncbi:MAG: phosphate/phosphite/phosphonate ABC transporter substrate-binding protein [Proteobacteria bacterium]|nr:phosphate/phosphite/phosphonate ABC transporter substrate-binding protein [Pseudomonadota bacterium]MBU1453431.1 phosphate/phosphite/phosphonate ABC transporter substrate-binding protein [Pseudomonadota bacterium]
MRRLTIRIFTIIGIFMLVTAELSLAADYKLSMLPRYSTEEINNRITPLAEYLRKKTGLNILPTLTSTFDQYLKQLSSGGIDIGFENPYIYVLAAESHEVIAMAVKGGDGDRFRGIIITRSDSSLSAIDDLIGKKVAIVGYTSAGGYLSQKLTLLENGIDVQKDCTIEEVPENKQENVVFSVYTGDVDAGFIRESAIDKAGDFIPSGAIRVMASTAWLPNWALSVSRNMQPEDREKIVKAIEELEPGHPVLLALKTKALRPARDSEYDPVRKAAGL